MNPILIGVVILLLLVPQVSASDYTLYKSIVPDCTTNGCILDNETASQLDYLFTKYTNHSTLKELIAKMEWLHEHEMKAK